MTDYPIHDALPEGFDFADRVQSASFVQTGSVDGASKVALVRVGKAVQLACRLRPPRDRGDRYISEYRAGWSEGRNSSNSGHAPAYKSQAASDGWLDATWGRMKWHLAYCHNHHNGNDGCGVVG